MSCILLNTVGWEGEGRSGLGFSVNHRCSTVAKWRTQPCALPGMSPLTLREVSSSNISFFTQMHFELLPTTPNINLNVSEVAPNQKLPYSLTKDSFRIFRRRLFHRGYKNSTCASGEAGF